MKKVHVIANNHIDREWTYDAQLTRMLTVKFFNDLIDTFEKIPDFQFVLDSQTVPLEDLLELFPEKRRQLKRYVEEKRLWVGPWYTAPDCFYLNGESVVRNLLVGHAVAAEFGNVSKFGYTPFGWGQISQLPQIYRGFGIDSLFFYRGADTIDANYYIWEGADGTQANCIKYHRTNFFDKVFRPMTKNRNPVPWDREIDYSGDEVPFMLGSDEYKYEHGFVVNGRIDIKADKIKDAIESFIESEANSFPGGLVLGMNGMDTCFPSQKGLLALDEVRKSENPDYEIKFSCLDEFSGELKAAVIHEKMKLQKHSGEMRRFLPGFGGSGKSEVKSTHFYLAAARPGQKSKNTKAESLLTRYAEPFATVSWLLGGAYPQEYILAAWKYLLKCHSHDTIAGCGIDQIEADMQNRLDQTINLSKAVMNTALQRITASIDNSEIKDDEIALLIFNPSPFKRAEVTGLWLHIPEKSGITDFEIVEKQSGKTLEFDIAERGEMTDRIFRDLTDTTLYAYGELVKINLKVELEGLGYKTLVVRKANSPVPNMTGAGAEDHIDDRIMENDYLRVKINDDGSFDIYHKESGTQYEGLHYFTDTGDNGDPWVRFVPDKNRLYSSRGSAAEITRISSSRLESGYEIRYSMMVPEGLKKDNYIMEGYYDYSESSDKLVPLKIKSVVTLGKNSKYLDIKTEIDNQSTDHLVQVVFSTRLKTDRVYAESGFDVVERGITVNEKNDDPSLVNGEDPMLRFVDIADRDRGLAILSDSVKGYEALGGKDNSIALNLIRSYTSQIVTIYGRKERRPEQILTQAQGVLKFHYAIYPHKGDWRNGCLEEAEKVNYPLIPVQTHRTFGKLPCEDAFVKFDSSKLVLSAFKKAEKDNAVILRLYNPQDVDVQSSVEFFTDIERVERVNLNEEAIGLKDEVKTSNRSTSNRSIRISVGARKIITLKITSSRLQL